MIAKTTLIESEYLNPYSLFTNSINFDLIQSFTANLVDKIVQRDGDAKVREFVAGGDDTRLLQNFTHIVEVGTLRSIALDRLYQHPGQLKNFSIILLLSYNITLGTELQKRGFSGLHPFPEQTEGYIFFSGKAIDLFKERIDNYMREANIYGFHTLEAYVNEMITVHLII